MSEHFDVLVVGAGLSGISAAVHLQDECPDHTFAILEGRDAIGGTWDLFRYPGIRSDSDMYTLGFRFRPWKGEQSIADGASIREYVKDTAHERGIDTKIRFGHRVERVSWSTDRAEWSVEVRRPESGEVVRFTCRFLVMCTGYYDYEEGYSPEFPDASRFQGRIVHPQKWTDDVVTKGKRVVVIGSGATAVTLVPELAKGAAKVTMLQRSPSYIVSLPAVDAVARFLEARLPGPAAYAIARWKNVAVTMATFNVMRAFPERTKKFLVGQVRKQVGKDIDVEQHFTPRYNPWDQRLCLVPDGDLFAALREGRAEIVTDHIERFTETGLLLKSGKRIEADVVVTATGLKLLVAGGIQIIVDGAVVDPGKTRNYKGAMLSDVPNFAIVLGYTNASWTLKADLISEYVCRVLRTMKKNGYAIAVPRVKNREAELDAEEPLMNFSSGYVQRALDQMPKQGPKAPWRLYQNYVLDLLGLRFGSVEDGVLELTRA
ncbi:MAG: flavin-binding family monooxygenase [Labilithrix sp.]|nr:flavin-binding family monooxygenase [Labilithrix sp.]